MPEIGITVTDRVARPDVRDAWAVCGNSDYTISWTLDEEWSAAHIRTAVFAWRDRHTNHSVPVIFEGNTCPMPAIPDALVCAVGLWASLPDGGEDHVLRTSSPAMITMRRSSTADTDKPVVTQDVYDELIAAVNGMLETMTDGLIDDTLTQSGKAADSKAVGDAIKEISALFYEVKTVEGDIIHIYDGADDMPLKHLSAGIRFSQAGTGVPTPDNIRPITGVGEITILHCGESEEDRPETIICEFPEPDGVAYVGNLNVLTGLVTITHRKIVFDGTENWQTDTYSSTGRRRYYLVVNDIMPDSVSPSARGRESEGWCSHYKVQTDVDSGEFYATGNIYALAYNNTVFSVKNKIVNVRHNNVSLADFKSFLASEYSSGHPVELVYKLQEPAYYSIGGHEIKTYAGRNIISAGGKNLVLSYCADRNISEVAYGAYRKRTASARPLKIYDGEKNLSIIALSAEVRMIQSGSGIPTPYNVRPITGVAALTLTHSGAESEGEPDIYGYTFPEEAGTVYYGSINIITGTLSVTHKKITFDGSDVWTKLPDQNIYYTESPSDAVEDNGLGVLSDGWSSHFNVYTDISSFRDFDYGIVYNNRSITKYPGRLYIKHADCATKADFLQFLNDQYNGSPVELVYRLRTPVTYRFDGAPLYMKAGINTFANTAGAVTATYYAMPYSVPYVTPQMYAAKGDGITDDTAAFQMAIDTGHDVFVPTALNEKYRITSTLNIKRSGQKIFSDSMWRGGSETTGGCVILDVCNCADDEEKKYYPLFRTNSIQMSHFYGLKFFAVDSSGTSGLENYGVLIDAATMISGAQIIANTLADKDVEVSYCTANNFYLAFNVRGRGFGLNDSSVASCSLVAKFSWTDSASPTHNPNKTGKYGQRSIMFRNNRLHSNNNTVYVESGHAYGLTFVNNTMDHGRGYILVAEDEAWNWVVESNTFDALYKTSAADAAIWFKNGAKFCCITGNVFSSEPDYWTVQYPRAALSPVDHYIKAGAPLEGCSITGNTFRVSLGSMLDLTAIPGTVVSGNVFHQPGYEPGYRPGEYDYPKQTDPEFPAAAAIALDGVTERATVAGNTLIPPEAGDPLAVNPNVRLIIAANGTKLNNSAVGGNAYGENGGFDDLRWSENLFSDEITKELTEEIECANITPELNLTESGFTASAGETGDVVIYGTLSSPRRLFCLNGQKILGYTSTTFRMTVDAGTYEVRTGASGHKTTYSWRYKFTTSGDEYTFASSDDPERIVHFEKPAMLFTLLSSNANFGTQDDPSRFTISLKRLSSIDVWARQEIDKLKSELSALQNGN